MNYTGSTTPSLAKAARFPLLRMLLAGFVLLLLGYSPAVMGQTLTVTTPLNYQLADGSSQDKVVVNISPIPASSTGVTFIINGGAGGDPVIFTDASGNATLPLTSPVVTNFPVEAEIVDPVTHIATIIGTVTVYFVATPGPVSISKSYLQVIQNPANADGVAQDIVEAVLFDANGVPENSNTAVTFNFTGAATMSTTGLSTGNIVTATFTSTTPGNVQVTGQVPAGFLSDLSNLANQFVNIQFLVLPPSLANSYIAAVTTPMPADGTSQDVVQAVVKNSLGQPVPDGTAVTFTYNVAGTTMTTTGVTVNGIATAYFTSLIVGPVQVQAQVSIGGVLTYLNDQSTPPNNFVTIQFVAPPPNLANSYIQAVTTPMPADGNSKDVVQAVVYNSLGQPVPDGTAVTFTYNVAGTTMTTTGVTVNGIATAFFTSLTPGPVQVQAQVSIGGVLTYLNDQSTPPNNFVTIQFVIPPPTLANSYITAVTTPMPADGTSQDVVQAVVENSLGQPVPDGTAVTFTYNVAGTTMTTTGVTVNGIATAYFTSLIVGPVQVQAQVSIGGVLTYLNDQSTPPKNYVTINFVAGPPVPSNPSNPVPPGGGGGSGGSGTGPSNPSDPSGPGGGYTYLTMTYNNVPADGVTADTATAYITDAEQHPVANVMVIFTLHIGGPANSGALFQPQAEVQDTVYTNANGFAAIAITDTVSGDAWIDASIVVGGVVEVIAGSSAIAHFTEAPDVNNPATQLITVVYEALADGTSTTVVKAHIVDASGNPITDQAVVFSIDSGSAQIITPGPWVTDANGDVFISLTSTTVGKVLITATVDGKSIIFGSPAPVYFAAINIYVPKVFTPNADGTNDVLKPILVGITTFHYFTVYNRWGNIIFTTQDPNQGWDGTFKGVSQPVETYLWIAEGINTEGKKIVQKGMTSLVR